MIYQDQIRGALADLDCSADFLCTVAGLGPAKLSRFLKEIQSLTGPELQNLMNTIEDLKALSRESQPLPLAFTNARIIGSLLKKRRAGLRLIPMLIGPADIVEELELEMATTDSHNQSRNLSQLG